MSTAVLTRPREVTTPDGTISTLDLEELFEGGGVNQPSKRVLVIGDLATSNDILLPVLKSIRNDFDVDKVYGTTFHDALRYDDGLLEHMAERAHVLVHGAGALALSGHRLRGMRSVMSIAGFEPQPLSHFTTTFYRQLTLSNSRRQTQSGPEFKSALSRLLKSEEVVFHPIFTVSMLRTIASMSTLAIMGTVRHIQDIPTTYVSMAHDEYGPLPPQDTVERAERKGVQRRMVAGKEAAHDYLLANPTLALTEAGFRQQLE